VKTLVLLAVVGLGAQLVDGSLGMAYGVTSTTLLLAIGTNPAAASATVHLAEIGTTLASGLSHWKFGNVDWRVVLRVGVPGAIGAFAGATVLSRLSTEVAAPVMSLILLALGIYLLVRFTLRGIDRRNLGKPLRKRFLTPLGLVAGFVDATGGGGWGPVGTPALLASGRLEPRKVIGSIDTSEFLVALASSLGFLLALGSQGVNVVWVLGLLAGGLVAAPIAAWLVRHIPPRLLGSLVGGVIVVTNIRTLLKSDWIDAADPVRYGVYAVLYAVWALAFVHSFRQYRKERALEPVAEPNVAAEASAVEAQPASSCASSSGGRPGSGRSGRGSGRPLRCIPAQVSATESRTGRLGRPSARAREVSTSQAVRAVPSASHSGRCAHSCTPAASRSSSGIVTHSTSPPVTSRQRSSRPPSVVMPAGPVVFTAPPWPRSAIATSQPARSRASTTAIGRSRCSGTTTRPPWAIRSSHQPRR
jgi:uncharacterized membrane protein YfcA